MRCLALLVPLALLGVSFAGPGFSLFGKLDYGIPWVVRGMETGTVCSTPPVWGISQQTVANKAVFVDLGAESAVSTALAEKGSALSPSTDANGAVIATDIDCWPSGTGTTGGYQTYEGVRNWVAEVNALRRSGGSPIKAILWYRFDTVAYPITALPGFEASFLADTARPWSEVTDFFSTNSDYACEAMDGITGYGCDETGGSCESACEGTGLCSDAANITDQRCGYNFCYSSFKLERAHTTTVQQCQRPDIYIDALSGATATTYQTKVHYFPHQTGIVTPDEYAKRFPFASGYITDLSNADYQAWQIARLTALWTLVRPWAHSFALTYKGDMYMCREPYSTDTDHSKAYHEINQAIGGGANYQCRGWTLGSPGSYTYTDGDGANANLTHAAYVSGGGTPWSAAPTGYGWTDFIQGFKAVTDGMRAAGVPYSLVWGELKPWWRSHGGAGGVEAGGWNETGTCNGPARCACDYSAATGVARSDGWQSGDGTDMCDFHDDPGTLAVNENTVVLGILRGAKLVLIGGSGLNTYSENARSAAVADLESNGVQVIIAPAGVSSYTDYITRPIP
jgi:hypothetical protein